MPSIVAIRPPVTVQAMSETGRPWTVMTAPAAPLTSTGRTCAAGMAARSESASSAGSSPWSRRQPLPGFSCAIYWIQPKAASRAAAQNQQYLELMETPPHDKAAQIARDLGWNPDLPSLQKDMVQKGLFNEVAADRADVSDAEAQRRKIERCDTPSKSAVCDVEIRYIYQVGRGSAPEQVFAQALLGFETIQQSMDAHEPGFVGINFVQAEDGFISMRDYTLQMKMLDYLNSVYPRVHIRS